MNRIVWKIAVFSIMILMGMNVASRALGTTQTPNVMLAGFREGCQDKPQPCWYGIVPGVTTLDEVRQTMSQQPEAHELAPIAFTLAYQLSSTAHVFFDSLYNVKVDRLVLKLDDHISIGEILNITGMPDRISFRNINDPASYGVNLNSASMSVIFLESQPPILNPHRNTSVLMVISTPVAQLNNVGFKWGGFVPFWKYCQTQRLRFSLC